MDRGIGIHRLRLRLSLACMESLTIYGLVIALVLLFANLLIKWA